MLMMHSTGRGLPMKKKMNSSRYSLRLKTLLQQHKRYARMLIWILPRDYILWSSIRNSWWSKYYSKVPWSPCWIWSLRWKKREHYPY
jgi:hypothetical protein